MLQFNELRISPDNKYLIVDVQVQELPYYDNINIDTIIIDTQKTYSATGPSNKPLFIIDGESVKHYRNFIDIDGVADNMFFVYVLTNGTPADNTPCGMSSSSILGVTYNKYPIYQQNIKMLNSIGGCEPSSDMIDYILQQKAFDLSLKTGNYTKAIEYWNIFFDNTEKVVNTNCGCYGKLR